MLVAIGLAIGLPLALRGGKFLGSQLYGLNPYDPVVIVLALVALTLSALIASSIPRRASQPHLSLLRASNRIIPPLLM